MHFMMTIGMMVKDVQVVPRRRSKSQPNSSNLCTASHHSIRIRTESICIGSFLAGILMCNIHKNYLLDMKGKIFFGFRLQVKNLKYPLLALHVVVCSVVCHCPPASNHNFYTGFPLFPEFHTLQFINPLPPSST